MWELNEERTYLDGALTVRRRPSDFIAFTTGDTRVWEAGGTETEALGKLVVTLSSGGKVVWPVCATSL